MTKTPEGKQKLNIIDFSDKDKVTIVPFGDNHLGSKDFNLKVFREHIDWVLKYKNTYALFMGDQLETATRNSVGAGIYEQDEIVDKQMQQWVNLVKPLAEAGKVIGIHKGNHEDRLWKDSGIDITRIICRELGVKYLGYTVMHLIRVKKFTYVVYSTHGHSGAVLPHTKIKACIDRGNIADADIYLMGHLHALDHHTRQYYTVDKRRRCVVYKEKHFVLCGSYLDHWDSYAEHAGYEMLKIGSPKLKLSGKEWRIRVSL